MSTLFAQLSEDQRGRVAVPRWRLQRALGATAAAVVLVGVGVASTEAFDHWRPTKAASTAAQTQALRTGTLVGAHSRLLGEIAAYEGHPSWIFMNIEGLGYDGRVICRLQADGGTTVASGSFELRAGRGQWARTIGVDVKQLHGVKITTPKGAVLASAVFSG